jgi:putative protein kinase ArgK-like GTPase of G3E family
MPCYNFAATANFSSLGYKEP